MHHGAMNPAPESQIVVLLHGFAGAAILNRPLTRMLRRAGYHAVELGYDSWGTSLEHIRDRLAPRLAQLDGRGADALHLVAHSMGGLVARALIHAERPRTLGRVVMLGTPNGGSEIADFLAGHALLRPILGRAGPALVTRRDTATDALLGQVDYPVGIIAGDRPIMRVAASRLVPGPSDGKVSVAATRLAEAADHVILPLPHSMLPYHASAHRQICHFLAHGRFEHSR